MKLRLDHLMLARGLAESRSQIENLIRLKKVTVDGKLVTKPGYYVREASDIAVAAEERYVSRAGLKLASVAQQLKLSFDGKTILDVGSSTGGFTDYALKHGAKKVYAVDVGTEQLHPSLRGDPRIDLHEKTDIRDFTMHDTPDVVVIDVSFISLRQVLPSVARLGGSSTQIVAMVKPQFEAPRDMAHRGVIKNETMRRSILKDFEQWTKDLFRIIDKADSAVVGSKGNRERFYLLMLKQG